MDCRRCIGTALFERKNANVKDVATRSSVTADVTLRAIAAFESAVGTSAVFTHTHRPLLMA